MATRAEWDDRYRAGEHAAAAPSRLVVEFTRLLTPGSALDLASGPGRNSLYLAERGWRVGAVDGSPVAIDLLRARALERKLVVDARLADLEAGEFEIPSEAFDLVLGCYFLERRLIAPMKAGLRPGGLAILIAHLAEADQPHGTPKRAHPGELRALFADWAIMYYREGEPEESGHRHAVAELVARKPG